MSEAETIARALGGKRAGAGWSCRCPAHEDTEPSLSVADGRDGRLLARCWAGCEWEAIRGALQARGLLPNGPDTGSVFQPRNRLFVRGAAPEMPDPEQLRRQALARKIWDEAVSPVGSLVERYLAGRAITMPMPTALRFHPRCWRSDVKQHLPAMIAAVQQPDGSVMGIVRTWLADGEIVTKAALANPKRSLGLCAGGAIRLAEPGSSLLIAEGAENALSVMQATSSPAWASGGTEFLKAMVLPALPLAETVVIAADSDAPGEAAAQSAARRWLAEGRKVRIMRPPAGLDWNDVIMGRTAGVLCDA